MKDLDIKNYPLPVYMRNKDYIAIVYNGSDLINFLKTNYLGLSILKESQKLGYDLKVGIQSNESMRKWIIDPLIYIDKGFKAPRKYHILNDDKGVSNHREIAQMLKIAYPFDVSYDENTGQDILICISGSVNISLKESIEQDLKTYFSTLGNVHLMSIPNYYESNNIHVGSIQEAMGFVEKSKIIISTDNFWLYLASIYKNKKVIGIFGPTIPDICTRQNSMKFIQFKDEDVCNRNILKSCPCVNPKYCHRTIKHPPYCLSKILSQDLIYKIKELLKE